MANCIFCMIGDKSIPSKIVFEDEKIICFHDLEPQAPVHVLIVPKKHIDSLAELQEEDGDLMAHIMLTVKHLVKILGLENGFRLVNNCGEDGMQSVQHLHFHLLGKRKMTWPPG